MERNPHLIDYYFVTTASAKSIEGIKRRLKKHGSLAHKGGSSKAQYASLYLVPKIVDRYPRVNRQDTPLLPWVARACLTRGVGVRTKPPPPKFSTFIGWNELGVKLYGACLLVFEKLNLPNQLENVYIPKALGFLSHYPLFYAFEVFLRCLWYSIPKKIITLEDLLLHYFYDIPAPAPGKKIAYDLGRMKVMLARRSIYDLPVLELPVATLFQRLSVENIVLLLKLLLLGSRIILVSSQETELSQVAESELTAVAETLISFLYPLKWNHLYIPIMSKKVGEKLVEYSGSFLVGIPAHFLRREEFSRLPRRAIIVDLQENEIRTASTGVIIKDKCPAWPPGREEKIKKALQQAATVFTNENRTRSQTYNCIKKIFIFMAHILKEAQAGRSRLSMSSPAESQFCKRLRDTNIFKEFCRWYHETRDNKDPKLQNVYQFFMDNAELGQEFAKPVKTNMENTGFDIKEYDTQFKMVNDTVIRQMEKSKCIRLPPGTNIKWERKKPNAPYIRDISSEAQKFINQHMLITRMEDRPRNKRRKQKSRRANVLSRKPCSSSKRSRNRSRPRTRQRCRTSPKPSDAFDLEVRNASYVSKWIQSVIDRKERSEQEHSKTHSLIITLRDLMGQLSMLKSGARSNCTPRTSCGTRGKLLQNAYHSVRKAKEHRISTDKALDEVLSHLGGLCSEPVDDEPSIGSTLDPLYDLTEEQIQKFMNGGDLSDGDYDDEYKDSNDDSIEEDWDAEFCDDSQGSSDGGLKLLDEQIGLKMAEDRALAGFAGHNCGSDAHMAELPDDLNDNFDINNDTPLKPLDEFLITHDEERYWRKVEIRNSKIVGKEQLLIPMSVDYFSDYIMEAWATRLM